MTEMVSVGLAPQELEGLYRVSRTMGTCLGVADTVALVSTTLPNLVPFSSCALFVAEESGEKWGCRFATGTESERLRKMVFRTGRGQNGWVVQHRMSLSDVPPAADFSEFGSIGTTTLQSALISPLIFNNRVVGTLALYHTTPHFYTGDHCRLLGHVCDHAAAVIHNALVFERTQAASLTDALTGLSNTRFVQSHVAAEIARANRSGREMSLVVLDLDDFKGINDAHGHLVGDRALRCVADVLRGAVRPYDVCARYAGDEFMLVLIDCGRAEAGRKQREIQDAVDRVAVEAGPGSRARLAISAGTASFPVDGKSYETLLLHADRRMYANKARRKRGSSVRQSRSLARHDAPAPTRGSSTAVR